MAENIAESASTSKDVIWLVLALLVLAMLADLLLRSVLPAVTNNASDFLDPFIGAHLWLRGENPYDKTLAEAAAEKLTGSAASVVPIYPPSAYVLVAPLSVLPWRQAKLFWALLSYLSVAVSAYSLVRIGRFQVSDLRAWLVIAVAFVFRPFHTAIEVGNVAVITTAMCLVAVGLALRKHDVAAGILLALATCLKPQNCIWVLLFYFISRQWRVVIAGVLTGLALAGTAVLRIPLTITALLANYSANLHYWFKPGGENDFSAANPFRFPIINCQIVISSLVRSRVVANGLAFSIFAAGFVIWTYVIWRRGVNSVPLCLSSLLALSFVASYHRVNDVGVLMLSLCWALLWESKRPSWTKPTVLVLALILAAGQSWTLRLAPSLPLVVTSSWWWKLVLLPYFVWVLLALCAILLYAVVESSRPTAVVQLSSAPQHDVSCS